jgi:hypothetical protein
MVPRIMGINHVAIWIEGDGVLQLKVHHRVRMVVDSLPGVKRRKV